MLGWQQNGVVLNDMNTVGVNSIPRIYFCLFIFVEEGKAQVG